MSKQLTTKKRVNPARYHIPEDMTRAMAKDNHIIGKGARIFCVASSSIFWWRLVALSVTPFGLGARIAILIIFAFVSVGICYMALPFVLAAIWRDSSQYHMRIFQKYLASYIYEHEDSEYEMNETSKGMYKLLLKLDDSVPTIATITMFFTFIGGWLAGFSLGAGWGVDLKSAFLAGYWPGFLAIAAIAGLFCTYASIKCPINVGHMRHHADMYGEHINRVDKAYSIEEVKRIVAGPKGLSTTTPAGSLSKGDTLPKLGKGKDYDATAQFRTLPNAADVEVDDMPGMGGK